MIVRRATAGAAPRARAVALVALLVALLTGCADGLDEEGEPLTVEQSEALAACRFRLGAGGAFSAVVSYGSDEDLDRLVATLTVDPATTEAWGTLSRGPADLAVEEPIQLWATGAAVLRGGTWQIDEAGELQHLLIVFSMVADRPENAQLLRQSEARYLGTSEIDGEPHSVYRLPTSTGDAGQSRLWLDEDGNLSRLDSGDDRFMVVVGAEPPEPRPDDGPLTEGTPDGA